MTTTTTYTVRETAAAMRKTLRAQYPGVRFSVRMSTGTGHGWLHVSWTDGPTDSAVRLFCSRFQSSQFDGQDDAYHQVNAATPYTCCGVLTHRDYSPAAEQWATNRLNDLTDPDAVHTLVRAEADYGPFHAASCAQGLLLNAADLRDVDLPPSTTTTPESQDA